MSKIKLAKKSDNPLPGQILELIPDAVPGKAIGAHMSDKHCHKYKTCNQLVLMMFRQLNKCHSLREIAQGINISPQFLKDMALSKAPPGPP